MPSTKGVSRTVAKWKARVAVAGGDYTAGVTNPKTPWSQGASQGAQAWAEGVSAAVGRGAFASGVAKAGDAKWSAASKALGATRYSPGVTFGEPYFTQGIQGVLSTIEGTSMNPRAAAGSASNYANVQKIGDALHAAKLAAKG
jgi:hypothetical protein